MGLFKNKRKHSSFHAENGSGKTLHKNLQFTATEQYNLIRANLDFTLPVDEKCPVIGVTSSMRGEGKSTTAVNLSYVFAKKGSKVLLIDADLRIPSVAKKLGIESSPGLADLLRGKGAQISEFQSHLLPNWFVLPSGDIPPNPSELLGSARMENILNQLREIFDYIIIDLPPVNIVSDAISISSLISGMIVVIREEYTEKKELERCFRQLKLSNVKILGCVMNETKTGSASYGRYKKYKYYKYYKYYQSEPAGTKK
ncbi:MAG: CpsD/CapB family tyrosine-protein kinase [Ruminococcaceae bacterium]|nr:CpsD/CapB family tyrosine-protein kinase [Oscillospiraceae bacterium]